MKKVAALEGQSSFTKDLFAHDDDFMRLKFMPCSEGAFWRYDHNKAHLKYHSHDNVHVYRLAHILTIS